jgi:phage-related minor tail protein
MPNSRIAEVYVQMVPLMGKDFAKKAQKAINDAFNTLDFGAISKSMSEALDDAVNQKGLVSDLQEAGTAGGKALKTAINAAIGNQAPDVNTRGVVQQAGADGKTAGHDLVRAMNNAIGNSAPDINTRGAVSQAETDGRSAGRKFASALSQAIQSANITLPTPNVPAGAASAGAQAGAQASQSFSQSFTSGLGNLSTGLKTAIVGAIAAVGIKELVSKGLEGAIKFDAGTREIAASLGLTAEESAKVSDITKSLYKQKYGETYDEVELATESVMTAFSDMRTGSQADIEALTGTILNMVEAFEVDTVRASTVAGQMVTTGFAKNSTDAVNLLIATFQKVPVGTREAILDSMDEYSGFFQDVGITGEAGMNLLINASKRGAISMDKTADAIKEIFIRVKDNGSASNDALKELGLDSSRVQHDLLQKGEVSTKMFEEIVSRISRIKDSAKKDQISIALFGGPGEDLGKGLPVLIDQLANLDNGLGNINETAKTFNEQMRDQFAVTYGSIMRTMELTFAEIFTPLLVELKPYLEEFMKWLVDNKEGIKDFFIQMGTAIVTVVKPALEVIVPMLSWLFDVIIQNKDAIAQWLPIILAVAGIAVVVGTLWTVGTAIWGLVSAFGAAFVAASGFAIGGVGLTVGAVGILVAAVFGLGYMIGTFLYENWDGIVEGFMTGIDWIVGAFQNLERTVGDIFNNIVNFITDSLFGITMPDWWGTTKQVIGGFISGGSAGGGLYGMAEGGDVQYRPGGTPVIISEKAPESVINTGLMNRNLELQNERLANVSTGQAPQITIIQQPGQSPQDLVRIVIEELNWQERR